MAEMAKDIDQVFKPAHAVCLRPAGTANIPARALSVPLWPQHATELDKPKTLPLSRKREGPQ